MIGQRYGRLVVTSMTEHRVGSEGRAGCVALCDCGTNKEYVVRNIRRGRTQSCGCLLADTTRQRRLTHGRSYGDRTYLSWCSMKRRCAVDPHYVGRVTICDRWQSFENFLADMGERPDGKTLDRIDSCGHYDPGNCRWATATEQARNRSTNRMVTLDGTTRCFAEWCEIAGIESKLAEKRLHLGWPERDAIFRPVRLLRRRAA